VDDVDDPPKLHPARIDDRASHEIVVEVLALTERNEFARRENVGADQPPGRMLIDPGEADEEMSLMAAHRLDPAFAGPLDGDDGDNESGPKRIGSAPSRLDFELAPDPEAPDDAP